MSTPRFRPIQTARRKSITCGASVILRRPRLRQLKSTRALSPPAAPNGNEPLIIRSRRHRLQPPAAPLRPTTSSVRSAPLLHCGDAGLCARAPVRMPASAFVLLPALLPPRRSDCRGSRGRCAPDPARRRSGRRTRRRRWRVGQGRHDAVRPAVVSCFSCGGRDARARGHGLTTCLLAALESTSNVVMCGSLRFLCVDVLEFAKVRLQCWPGWAGGRRGGSCALPPRDRDDRCSERVEDRQHV